MFKAAMELGPANTQFMAAVFDICAHFCITRDQLRERQIEPDIGYKYLHMIVIYPQVSIFQNSSFWRLLARSQPEMAITTGDGRIWTWEEDYALHMLI